MALALRVFFQRIQDDIDLGPVPVLAEREPVADDAGAVDHENDRQRDAVPRTALFELRVGDAEGGDDLGLGVRQQRVADIACLGEAPERAGFVMGDQGDVIAERVKVLDAGVPGDRLDLQAPLCIISTWLPNSPISPLGSA